MFRFPNGTWDAKESFTKLEIIEFSKSKKNSKKSAISDELSIPKEHHVKNWQIKFVTFQEKPVEPHLIKIAHCSACGWNYIVDEKE